MTADEQVGLRRLSCAKTLLNLDGLDARIKCIPYGARDLGMIRAKIKRLMDEIMNTVPDDQQPGLKRNLRQLSINIGQKKPVASTYEQDYGLWVSYEGINGLMEAAHETCMMCGKRGKEQQTCPLRKGLNELPVERINETKGECPYYGRI